jgi:hypothetical protein
MPCRRWWVSSHWTRAVSWARRSSTTRLVFRRGASAFARRGRGIEDGGEGLDKDADNIFGRGSAERPGGSSRGTVELFGRREVMWISFSRPGLGDDLLQVRDQDTERCPEHLGEPFVVVEHRRPPLLS